MSGDNTKNETLTSAAREQRVWLGQYANMQRIRKLEECLLELNAKGEIPGFMHLTMGQESVPVAVSTHLRQHDTITLTHRAHGQAISKGMSPAALIAELLGLDNGVCQGRGGSMHLADTSVGILGANGIVGGGLPIAAGSALAHKLDQTDNISVAYFGDGALAEGVFHECFNLSALWDLPCLFVCENNGWSEYSPSDQQFCGSLERIAASFGIDYAFIDGADVSAVAKLVGTMISTIRSSSRPQILEVAVQRLHGHHAGDAQTYRNSNDLAKAKQRDPIALLRIRLEDAGLHERLRLIDDDIDHEIGAALNSARSGQPPQLRPSDTYAR